MGDYIRNMGRCVCCRKKNHMDLACKWCSQSVCTRCVLPEVHQCPSLSECVAHKTLELNTRLHEEQVRKRKLEAI